MKSNQQLSQRQTGQQQQDPKNSQAETKAAIEQMSLYKKLKNKTAQSNSQNSSNIQSAKSLNPSNQSPKNNFTSQAFLNLAMQKESHKLT